MADVCGWRVIVDVAPLDAELVADALFQAGATGIEECYDGDRVTLLAGMPDEADARAFAAGHPGARVEPVVDDRWADEWRAWAKPVLVDGVLVQPAWLSTTPEHTAAAKWIVMLDPGRAFGSGSHETTKLALAQLLAHTPSGGRVLDVGCGSGVLSVAAASARGGRVVAVDIDAHAVQVTRENAARNNVEHLVDARELTSVGAAVDDLLVLAPGGFDVVVANILAVTLREIAGDLARLVAPSGVVVLSGVLAEQVASVDDAYAAVGLHLVAEHADGDWRALVYAPGAPHR